MPLSLLVTLLGIAATLLLAGLTALWRAASLTARAQAMLDRLVADVRDLEPLRQTLAAYEVRLAACERETERLREWRHAQGNLVSPEQAAAAIEMLRREQERRDEERRARGGE